MRPFSTPWKQKTVKFSDFFRGQSKGALGTNGLMDNLLIFKMCLTILGRCAVKG